MRVLFQDAVAATPYDAEIMRARGLGGTEGTVVRVAEGLSAYHGVVVAQRARTQASSPHRNLRYLSLNDQDPFGGPPPDWVVVLRKPRLVPQMRARYPSASMLSWMHNWQRPRMIVLRAGLARSRCPIVAVSEVHREAIDRLVNHPAARLLGSFIGGGATIPVRRIYNPVDEGLSADATPFDCNKLVFFSNKGINQVLRTFKSVRREMPSLRLYVAGISAETLERDPRYDRALARGEGVHLLGRVTQQELFRHIRESLCVFYPQNALAETFGLVFAESNALGTPVLAHDFGSAREVLGGAEQLVDARDLPAIVARLRRWQEGNRPRVSLRPQFRLSSVVAQWRELLEGATDLPARRRRERVPKQASGEG